MTEQIDSDLPPGNDMNAVPPSEAPAVPQLAPQPIASKPSRKWLFLVGGVVVILILAAVLRLGYQKASNYNKVVKSYVSSNDFKGFTDANSTFLSDGNGVLAKMYSCQATADDLWQPHSFTKVPYDSLDMQYLRLQGDMVVAREYARKLSAPAAYKSDPVSNLFSPAKSVKIAAEAQQLLSISKNFAYSGQNVRTDFCTRKLYSILIPMSYLDQYSQKGSIQTTLLSDVVFRIAYIDKAKNGALSFVTYNDNPSQMAGVNQELNDWLTHLQADLNTLLSLRKSNSDVGNLQAAFAQDKADLDSHVLGLASTEGKNIMPTTQNLKTLVDDITAFRK